MIEISEVSIIIFAIVIFVVGYVVYTALDNEVKEVGCCNLKWKERVALCEGKYMGKIIWTSQGEYCQTKNYTYKTC